MKFIEEDLQFDSFFKTQRNYTALESEPKQTTAVDIKDKQLSTLRIMLSKQEKSRKKGKIVRTRIRS